MSTTTPFGDPTDVFRWLDGFINLERGQSNNSFRLDRMELLARLAGHPERTAPAIHVAGSKGKGSVTAMIASILDAAGMATGLYVSPHVVDYRERVGFARGPFPDEIYVAAGDELRAVVEAALGESSGDHKLRGNLMQEVFPGGEEPTFFELMTLLFFLCARHAQCRALAVETGMGGRLDATNIVDPTASVITPIELEHTEYLGTSIAAIAAEKAGIIKTGRPVIVSEQESEALTVFQSTAAARSTQLRYLPDEVRIEDLSVDREGTSARLVFSDSSIFPKPLNIRLALVGEVQAKNAALASLAVRIAFPEVDETTIVSALSRTTLPARFERVAEDPPIVIDGAHTERSVRLAADAFSALYGDGGILLFGCALGKDVSAMARILSPRFSRIFVTAPGTFKRSDPDAAYLAFASLGAPAQLIAETETAISAAIAAAETEGKPLLTVGSFYLAAAIRTRFTRGIRIR
jgi:dihydrofolate synthase/folylpolyglutamate synthase